MRWFKSRKGIGAPLWAVLLAAGAAAQLQPHSEAALDPGFKSRAMAHVRQIAAVGIHEAGSSGERRVARYVREQMKKAGLSVTDEPFMFQSFTLDDAVLEVGTEKADIVRLGFDPYSQKDPISGELAFVTVTDQDSILKTDLDGKIVVLAGNAGFSIVSLFRDRLARKLTTAAYQKKCARTQYPSPSFRVTIHPRTAFWGGSSPRLT